MGPPLLSAGKDRWLCTAGVSRVRKKARGCYGAGVEKERREGGKDIRGAAREIGDLASRRRNLRAVEPEEYGRRNLDGKIGAIIKKRRRGGAVGGR